MSETLAGTTKLKIGYIYIYIGCTYVILSSDPDAQLFDK